MAVLPLGTGNDLSLSFGWGNAFLPSWLRNFASVYNMLRRVADAKPRDLDCWRISMSAGKSSPVPKTCRSCCYLCRTQRCTASDCNTQTVWLHSSFGGPRNICTDRWRCS